MFTLNVAMRTAGVVCAGVLALASAGCQSDARVAEPKVADREQPAAHAKPAETAEPGTADESASAEKPAAATREPEVQPPAREESPPKLPDFVTVTRRFEASRDFRLVVTPQGERRLIVESENVQRIKLDRSRIPLRKDKSIILQLDGQPIEWLVDSPVTEFERTVNGAWVALPPPRQR